MDFNLLVHELDWIKNPCRPICPSVIRADSSSSGAISKVKPKMQIINYQNLMNELENILCK